MNEDTVNVLNTTNKEEIAEYLFERTVIDLALQGREILNKVITKQFHEADLPTLTTIAATLQHYAVVACGQMEPKEAMPYFVQQAFVKFTEKFSRPQTEPMIKGTP